MKFTCPVQEFKTQLAAAGRATAQRSLNPAWGKVLIKAAELDQLVTLTGFDGRMGIQANLTAEVTRTGSLAVSPSLIQEIVTQAAGETLTMTTKGEQLFLASGPSQYEISGSDGELFPVVPEVEAPLMLEVGQEDLAAALQGTLFAASTEEGKQVLMGARLTFDETGLEVAATDGHRLAIAQLSQGGFNSLEVTIPARALGEVERALKAARDRKTEGEKLKMMVGSTQAAFFFPHQTITTQLMDGQYPNYRKLLPPSFKYHVTVERRLLLAALSRVAVLADKHNPVVKMDIQEADQQLTLTVNTPDVGKGEESLPAQIAGGDLTVAMNTRYLTQGLKVLSGNEVHLELNGPLTPVIFQSRGVIHVTYLVMPVQLRS